ncbi:DNA-binding IclR family transcriptional regulator [Nitrobacteraceae bacterium AZCC 2146]
MSKSNFWSSIETAKDVESKLPAAVKSAARTLRVIEFFVEVRRRARANEIADRLGLPQSSASALLNSMVRLGYLDFDYATHTFQPTLRVAMLGAWLEDGPFRDGSMVSMIEGLANETGHAVSLSTRNDIHVRYMYTIQSRDPAVARITLAIRRYAVWSASGMALLASKPQGDVKALIRRTRAEDDPFVRQIKAAQVLERLDEATRQGYSFSRGLVTQGAGSIAMKLPSSLTGDHEEIALSVAGDLEKLTNAETKIVTLIRDAVAALETKHAR